MPVATDFNRPAAEPRILEPMLIDQVSLVPGLMIPGLPQTLGGLIGVSPARRYQAFHVPIGMERGLVIPRGNNRAAINLDVGISVEDPAAPVVLYIPREQRFMHRQLPDGEPGNP